MCSVCMCWCNDCSGGLSNLLYCCWLADSVPAVGREPRRVLLRIYGQIIHGHPDMVLTDSVIFALLAEKGMGPKLYGVFTTGRLEEYVPVCTGSPGACSIVSCSTAVSQFNFMVAQKTGTLPLKKVANTRLPSVWFRS